MIWLAIFGSLMLWLWQLGHGIFAANALEQDLALFAYGLALVTLPLLFLRWAGMRISPRLFVLFAVCGLLLIHFSFEDTPSLAALLYGHFGMPSMATVALASVAATRLFGNKHWLIHPTQFNWFAAGVLVCLAAQWMSQTILAALPESQSQADAALGFTWLSVVWAVGCVGCACLCQWRGRSLCALWLVCGLIGWTMNGATYHRAGYPAVGVSDVGVAAGAGQCSGSLDAASRRDCVESSAVIDRVRPLVGGKEIARDPYPYPPELVGPRRQAEGGLLGPGDWLSDWFAATCALLWLLRGVHSARRHRDH